MYKYLSLILVLLAWSEGAQAQKNQPQPTYFQKIEKGLVVGVVYHPEQVPEKYWDADFARIAQMGFGFVQLGVNGWAAYEPAQGRYEWLWLDRCLDLAARYKLKLVLNTATTTLPPWLIKKYAEAEAKGADGQPYPGKHLRGSVFNSGYQAAAQELTITLARRYGDNTGIAGWIVPIPPVWDYSPQALLALQGFAKEKIHNLDSLNYRWATQESGTPYASWDEIRLPRAGNGVEAVWQDFTNLQKAAAQAYLNTQLAALLRFTTNQFALPVYTLPAGQTLPSFYLQIPKGAGISQEAELLGKEDFSTIGLAQALVCGTEPTVLTSLPIGNGVNLPKPGEVKRMLWQQFALGARFVCLKTEGRLAGLLEANGQSQTRVVKEITETLIDMEALRSFETPTATLPYSLARQKIQILINKNELAGTLQNARSANLPVLQAYGAALSIGAPIKIQVPFADINTSDSPVLLVSGYATATETDIKAWKQHLIKDGQLLVWPGTAQKEATGPKALRAIGYKLEPLFHTKIDEIFLPDITDSSALVYQNKDYKLGPSEILTLPPAYEDSVKVLARYTTAAFAGRAAIISLKKPHGQGVYLGAVGSGLERQVLKDMLTNANVKPISLPVGVYGGWQRGVYVVINTTQNPYSPSPYLFPTDRLVGIGPDVGPGAVAVYKMVK